MAKTMKISVIRFSSIIEVDYLLFLLSKNKPALDKVGTHTTITTAIKKVKEDMEEENEANLKNQER